MLSCGMFASLAVSIAVLRRMFAFGSPPPFRAATVISRRIFEKSFPRSTSALPFLRLICDHRECPDIALSSDHFPARLAALAPGTLGRRSARPPSDHFPARLAALAPGTLGRRSARTPSDHFTAPPPAPPPGAPRPPPARTPP